MVLVLVGIGVALALSWLVVTAWQRARPPAVAEIKAFHVVSDTKIEITLSVERPNPSVIATCRLIAQAQDLGLVGEQAVSSAPERSTPSGRRCQHDHPTASCLAKRARLHADVRGQACSLGGLRPTVS